MLVVALCLSTASCYGDLFKLSYVFDSSSYGSGTVVTGAFTGTANGDLITNISNTALFFDGGYLGPIFYSENYEDTGPAVVSFDGLQNDFVFAGTSGYMFLSVTNVPNVDAVLALNFVDSGVVALGELNPNNWKVVDVSTSSVPDGDANTLILLGLGITSLACVRRWKSGTRRLPGGA